MFGHTMLSAGFNGYANSKLATLLAAKEWQRHFRASESTKDDIAVAVHPGLVDTELARGWLTGTDVTGKPHVLLLNCQLRFRASEIWVLRSAL